MTNLSSGATGFFARRPMSIGPWFLSAVLAFAATTSCPSLHAQASTALLLFGGLNHKTFLGCLNCSEYSADSVLNPYGHYGSPYSSQSIFNKYSQYGSRYSPYGACNPYATDPPVIVDNDGNYYGRLTLNKYHRQIGIGTKLLGWLASICE